MTHEAVGRGLDKKWSMPRAHLLDHCTHHIADSQHIHPIDAFGLNAVRASRLRNIVIECNGPFNRCPHAIAIILADEDHRKLPQGREIEGFVCLTARDRPFTEEAGGHKVQRLILSRKSKACGKGNMASNNGIAAHKSALGIHQVHGPSFASAKASCFAEELSHHLAWIGPSGKAMSMVAVGTDHIVVRSKSSKRTDCNGFFADIQMEKTGNFCEGIHFGRFFFKPADQQHLAIQREEICSVHACHYAWMLRVDSTPIW